MKTIISDYGEALVFIVMGASFVGILMHFLMQLS